MPDEIVLAEQFSMKRYAYTEKNLPILVINFS